MIGFRLVESMGTEDGWKFRVHVPADSPYFAGHFPGEPILPGVAQLALAAELLSIGLGPEHSLAGIRTLRFRAPVRPDEFLDGHLRPASRPGEVQFHLERDGEAVADGFLMVATENPE